MLSYEFLLLTAPPVQSQISVPVFSHWVVRQLCLYYNTAVKEIQSLLVQTENINFALMVVNMMMIIQLNSILYFNVLVQQLQEPITESARENKVSTKSR
jgi:hypothetical protein